MRILILLITTSILVENGKSAGLIEVFGWKQMDFYETESANNTFIPYNNVPIGATQFDGRLFITVARRRPGIPSTLNYIDLRHEGHLYSPKLRAYPNFEVNQLSPNLTPNSNRLISVYRPTVDACQRLWFVDTGMLEYPGEMQQIQRPAIWIMDLRTDRLLRRVQIPESVVEVGRGMTSITVDVAPGNCSDAYAYITDLLNGQLYVYSWRTERISSINHDTFKFEPPFNELSIAGLNFTWSDSIFSTTLGPYQDDGHRLVFFHPMASTKEFVVASAVLQGHQKYAPYDQDFRLLGNRGTNRQCTMHKYDPYTGVIFYAEIQRNGVGCWNTRRPFCAQNHGTVAQDDQRMIYPSDLTIDDRGTLWILTNSIPLFVFSQLDANVVNFRVWKQDVSVAIRGTVCE